MNPYTREKIENWVSDFCSSDDVREFAGGLREYAGEILSKFAVAACSVRGIEPDELEEADVRAALFGTVAKLNLPAGVKKDAPLLCAAFLTQLEEVGRLGGGRSLAVYVRAMRTGFEDASADKVKPITRPGSRLGRNDPCPCGSGKKYKKCCMSE